MSRTVLAASRFIADIAWSATVVHGDARSTGHPGIARQLPEEISGFRSRRFFSSAFSLCQSFRSLRPVRQERKDQATCVRAASGGVQVGDSQLI